MQKRIFNEITPFNLFPLASCFEYGYVSAFSRMGGSVENYFMNKVAYCRYLGDQMCLSTFDVMSREENERRNGVTSEKISVFEPNIVNRIIEELTLGNLVMVRVRYAVSYVFDSGRKTEGSYTEHWIMCFGIDPEKSEFDIIEHEKVLSMKYVHCRIKFSDLEAAYAVNKDTKYYNMLIIKKGESVTNEVSAVDFRNRLTDYKKQYETSLESLRRYLKETASRAEKEEEVDEKGVMLFTEIIKVIQIDLWLLSRFGIGYSKADELLKYLNLERTFLTKIALYPSNRSFSMLVDISHKSEIEVENYFKYLFSLI